MKIKYLLSSNFNYDVYLCPDVGTRYSDLIGIDSVFFNREALQESCVYIADPQMSHREVDDLRSLIKQARIRIVFRIIDPYWPPQDNNPLRLLAFDTAYHARTAVLSAYQPAEVVDLLKRVYGQKRFHVSPYPYDARKELPFDWASRKRKVAISGNHNPALYPLRALARRKRLTSPRWRLTTVDLSHPGYTVHRPERSIVGDAYIKYLSRYKMMFVSPSRASLEFLKYRECAYAGCCPIGQSPKGFPAEAADSIIDTALTHFDVQFRKIQKALDEELYDRAVSYRAALARDRVPKLLHEQLFRWIYSVYG